MDLKRSSDSSGARMSSGSEFQTTGPETRKLLGPKRRVLVRGTVRSPRIPDRRWALAPTSRTGLQVRLRYRQFRSSNVLGQWVPNDRSRDPEASGPEATGPGSRHSQVTSNSRSQVSPGADLSDGIASGAEVCRTTTMKGVVNKNCDLVVDTLTNGKPVELIPQHRSDMVELPPVRDQPGCGVEDRLQSSRDNVCGTVEDTVTVIDTTWYEGMDQCFRGIRGKWSSYRSQLSQLIKTAARDVVDMQVHSQFTVECHAEILGGGRRFNGVFTDRHGLCVDLRQLLSGSKPHELSLVGVQLQPIRLHPTLDLFRCTQPIWEQQTVGRRLGNGGKVKRLWQVHRYSITINRVER